MVVKFLVFFIVGFDVIFKFIFILFVIIFVSVVFLRFGGLYKSIWFNCLFFDLVVFINILSCFLDFFWFK